MPVYSTGSWRPFEGQAEAFVEAWREFMSWASGFAGAGEIRLARDVRDPGRFVSFAAWDDMESVRAWKGSAEFKQRMSLVQKHIDTFAPTELEVVETLEARTSKSP